MRIKQSNQCDQIRGLYEHSLRSDMGIRFLFKQNKIPFNGINRMFNNGDTITIIDRSSLHWHIEYVSGKFLIERIDRDDKQKI